jgi:hypothetical protein
MTWNPAGDHHHPTDVTYVKPDGSQATISADRLPFVIEGDVTVETMGAVVRSGVCTQCGQRVMSSTRWGIRSSGPLVAETEELSDRTPAA